MTRWALHRFADEATPPAGKRRDAAFKQKGVYLKAETIDLAVERLRHRGDKTDFSELSAAFAGSVAPNTGVIMKCPHCRTVK